MLPPTSDFHVLLPSTQGPLQRPLSPPESTTPARTAPTPRPGGLPSRWRGQQVGGGRRRPGGPVALGIGVAGVSLTPTRMPPSQTPSTAPDPASPGLGSAPTPAPLFSCAPRPSPGRAPPAPHPRRPPRGPPHSRHVRRRLLPVLSALEAARRARNTSPGPLPPPPRLRPASSFPSKAAK